MIGVTFAKIYLHLVILTLSPTLNLRFLRFVSISSAKAEQSASIYFYKWNDDQYYFIYLPTYSNNQDKVIIINFYSYRFYPSKFI